MDIDIEKNKQEFNELLRSVGREGTDYLIEDLEALGFYEAPSSTRFHLACDGGNVQHSLNTCRAGLMLREQMLQMRPELASYLPKDSVIVVLRSGFDISDNEMLAIRWHMGAWDLAFQSPEQKNNINTARDKSPLCGLLQLADGIAANLIEWGTGKEEELW